MAGKIVSLRGDIVLNDNDPDPDLIKMIEGLLEEAKSGDLRGIGYSGIYRNNFIKNDWDGPASAFVLLGALHYLTHELQSAMDEME